MNNKNILNNILVTGGAGYIGSVVVNQLIEKGKKVTVFDNFSTGHKEAIEDLNAEIITGDIHNRELLSEIMKGRKIQAVVHFAASIEAGESMSVPEKFFENNTVGSIQLLRAVLEAKVKNFVFSSTAAVYGMPKTIPITETADLNPINVYGESKLMIEKILSWFYQIHGLNYTALRYFNACGATDNNGENHLPETHLIPLAIQAAAGKRDKLNLFGTDYPTPDGTCIRDYIHVSDLAHAHLLALDKLGREGGKHIYNLGSQNGFSNREVIKAVQEVSGKKVPVEESERRKGDPAVLIASSEKIRRELGWKARITKLPEIIESAYRWYQIHPEGYKS